MSKKLNPKHLYLLCCFTAIIYCDKIFAQCGVPPTSGSVTVSIANNIVNTYYAGTGNPGAGSATLTVGGIDSRGNATAISAGDLVLIIQIQGADFNITNSDFYGDNVPGDPASGYEGSNLRAGYYEYNTVSSIAGSVITFGYPLANSYFDRDFSAGNSIQRYEVIRIPRYYDFRIKSGASVTCPSWNGQTGGVVVIDVEDIFNLRGSIDVSYKGFRGGGGKNLTGATAGNTNGTGVLTNTDYRWNSPITTAANLTGGSKGEGIAGTPVYLFNYGTTLTTTGTLEGYIGGSMGRGAPGNAGGGATDGSPSLNQYNSGGGGGGNGGRGGNGGSGWHGASGDVTTYPTGGYGGNAFAEVSTSRFCMGGGGGAGSANNSLSSNEYSCGGGGGGGIILVRAGQYTGTGSVLANGSNAPGVTATFTPSQTDAAGGGGAGGTIVMVTTGPGTVGLNNIIASAAGGNGGDMTNYYDYGTGGGGGGGVIITNGTFLSTNVIGGDNGLTRSVSPTGAIDNDYGAALGIDGQVISLTSAPKFINAINPGSPCGTLPVTLTDFTAISKINAVNLQWKIANVINLNKFQLEYSVDGISFSSLAVISYQDNVSNYNYTHLTASAKNFYRLKMIDTDGRFFYSKILSVQRNSSQNKLVLMYPNPAYNDLTLKLSVLQNEKADVKVIDNSGRIVINKIFSLQQGDNYLSIDGIEKLPASLYFVKIKSITLDSTEKLIVNKK